MKEPLELDPLVALKVEERYLNESFPKILAKDHQQVVQCNDKKLIVFWDFSFAVFLLLF